MRDLIERAIRWSLERLPAVVGLLLGLQPVLGQTATLPGAPLDGWVQWEVARVAGQGDACCYEAGKRGCHLGRTVGGPPSPQAVSVQSAGIDRLHVYAHLQSGRAHEVHAVAADCPVSVAGGLTDLGPLSDERSLDWLASQLERTPRRAVDGVLAAIALHAAEGATTHLTRLSGDGRSVHVRKQAMFWLGQARGAAGMARLLPMSREETSTPLLRHLGFVLSQSDLPEAHARLIEMAVAHPQRDVRGDARFWMAQAGLPGAEEHLLAALKVDDGTAVLQHTVFALSQLPERGVAALIEVVEGPYPREAKSQALFWLAQSESEAAFAYLEARLSASD